MIKSSRSEQWICAAAVVEDDKDLWLFLAVPVSSLS